MRPPRHYKPEPRRRVDDVEMITTRNVIAGLCLRECMASAWI
jgi:hypothetical protein